MKATPLGGASEPAVRRLLEARGWDPGRAETAADGLRSQTILLSEIDQGTLEALVRHAGSLGIDVLTGEAWALVSGSRARLSALARPWGGPPELAPLAVSLATAVGPELPTRWSTGRGIISLDTPFIVGIVNVTPDSFSDGGAHQTPAAVVAHVAHLVEAGATMVDIGGESTRPGRPEPVTSTEELDRVLPVLRAVVQAHPDLPVSIDTVKAAVADPCLAAGAAVINDVSGLRLDPDLGQVVAARGAGLILMHSRGTVSDMATYDHAGYGPDPVSEVLAELDAAVDRARAAGVDRDYLVVDPGLGFAKTAETSLLMLENVGALAALGLPILVGPSRKRFLGAATGKGTTERDVATAAACALAYGRGARLFRVHNPGPTAEALAIATALRNPDAYRNS